MPLTDTSCKNAKLSEKARKISDGGGLYLEVMPTGSKYWRLKYRFDGKEKRLAFGVYPEVSLREARDKRDEARKQIASGVDPSQSKKLAKLTQHINRANSFEALAQEWHENKTLTWTPRHSHYVMQRLKADIFPLLGSRPISDITAPELLAVLKIIEKRGAIEIAHRALQTCGQIFRYAIVTGRAVRDVSSDLRGALKTRKAENYKRLQENELPEFFAKLETYEGDLKTKLAIKLLVLTFVRTGELRGARWDEIDLDKAEWRIPAERMKMRDPHIVPLSQQAIATIKELEPLSRHTDFLFPSHTTIKHMSENTILYALYRMGYHSRATGHGFRATASTILNEHDFRSDVIERQLAHAERNKVRASYNHAQYLKERREMMQWWGDYLDGVRAEK